MATVDNTLLICGIFFCSFAQKNHPENVKQIRANLEIVLGPEKEARDPGKQTMPLLWLRLKENETKCNL